MHLLYVHIYAYRQVMTQGCYLQNKTKKTKPKKQTMRQVVCQCINMHFYISVFILALYYISTKDNKTEYTLRESSFGLSLSSLLYLIRCLFT